MPGRRASPSVPWRNPSDPDRLSSSTVGDTEAARTQAPKSAVSKTQVSKTQVSKTQVPKGQSTKALRAKSQPTKARAARVTGTGSASARGGTSRGATSTRTGGRTRRTARAPQAATAPAIAQTPATGKTPRQSKPPKPVKARTTAKATRSTQVATGAARAQPAHRPASARQRQADDRRRAIAADLGVAKDFDVEPEAGRRIQFLVDQLAARGARGFVLGVSGAVDSATVGRLCQLAVERVRAEGGEAEFVTVRLPYYVHVDEQDALRALDFVQPDETITVNVGPAADELWGALIVGGLGMPEGDVADGVRGNVRARLRMAAQYAVAGVRGLLVVGPDHAAEGVTGSSAGHGDGTRELAPLAGLTKRRVRALATYLGAPEEVVAKVSTSGLENTRPRYPDEEAVGVTDDEIDDYLEGAPVDADAMAAIQAWYARMAHNRELPVAPPS